MPVRLTLEQLKEKLRLKNPNIIIESNEYYNRETSLQLRCLREGCNHTWYKKAKMLNRKVICPECENSRLLSVDKIRDYVESMGFKFVTASNIDDGAKCKIEIICPNGHIIHTSWGSFAYQKCRCNKGKCNVTGEKLRRSKEEIIKEIEMNGYKVVDGQQEYENTKSKITLICKNNHRWTVSYNHFLKVRECPDCDGFRRPYTYEEVKEIFQKEGCKLLEYEYKDTRTQMNYQCVCGSNRYKIRLHDFLRGVRCKRCANTESRSFDEIQALFKERGHTLLETENMGSRYPHAYQCKCGNTSSITISNLLRGVSCMECYLKSNRGENHPNYNPKLTLQERQKNRKYYEYQIWRRSVYERDKYTCQSCGDKTGGNLEAHHLDGHDWCKDKRTDVNNGITLCNKCHMDFHKMYGYKGSTREKFNAWLIKRVRS